MVYIVEYYTTIGLDYSIFFEKEYAIEFKEETKKYYGDDLRYIEIKEINVSEKTINNI